MQQIAAQTALRKRIALQMMAQRQHAAPRTIATSALNTPPMGDANVMQYLAQQQALQQAAQDAERRRLLEQQQEAQDQQPQMVAGGV
jgi:hypothetical protein